MPAPRSPDIVLLRSADSPDPYVQAFAEAGWQAECRPVLRFTFPADEALRDRLRSPDVYSGLIATSPRAVRALRRVFDDAGPLQAAWKGRTAYAVGPKTAEGLRALSLEVRGAEAGNAEALAARIADDVPGRPLLFLSGSHRRKALPQGLRAAAVPFEEQVVYESHTRTDLELPTPTGEGWLAFFSPSGLEAVEGADRKALRRFRCAAIGPTTAGRLRDAGWAVDAVADAPTPEALVRAVVDASSDAP
jgi:uroporphyrinogen-III synthase